jgi:hypothetical protein
VSVIAQGYLTGLGIKEIIVVDTEKAFAENHSPQFRNWAAPEATLALLRALHERQGLSEASQALLLKYMTDSTPGAKRLKGLLPAGTGARAPSIRLALSCGFVNGLNWLPASTSTDDLQNQFHKS